MRIALVGNLAGVSNEVLLGLRSAGVDATLFITLSDVRNTFNEDCTQVDPAWVSLLDRLPVLAKFPGSLRSIIRDITAQPLNLRGFDLLHSHTCALNFSIGAFGLYSMMGLRPYLAFATGSDFREMKSQVGMNRYMTEQHFRRAKKVLLLNTDMLSIKDSFGFPEAEFFPFVLNEDEYSPAHIDRPSWLQGKFLCFMMSNLDFGITDNKIGRNSMKYNDRFLHAIAQYRLENPLVHAIVLDRGPDKEVAKQLVSDLGISDCVTFVPELNRVERIRYMRMADIVADQFYIGAFGLGALEALSLGKPLLTYLNENCIGECYAEPPPILNAQTTAEILAQLRRADSQDFREDLSLRARRWLLRNHSRHIVIQRLVDLYEETLRG